MADIEIDEATGQSAIAGRRTARSTNDASRELRWPPRGLGGLAWDWNGRGYHAGHRVGRAKFRFFHIVIGLVVVVLVIGLIVVLVVEFELGAVEFAGRFRVELVFERSSSPSSSSVSTTSSATSGLSTSGSTFDSTSTAGNRSGIVQSSGGAHTSSTTSSHTGASTSAAATSANPRWVRPDGCGCAQLSRCILQHRV